MEENSVVEAILIVDNVETNVNSTDHYYFVLLWYPNKSKTLISEFSRKCHKVANPKFDLIDWAVQGWWCSKLYWYYQQLQHWLEVKYLHRKQEGRKWQSNITFVFYWSYTFNFREDRDLIGQGIGLGIGLFECFISGRWQWKWFPCDPLETAEGWTAQFA